MATNFQLCFPLRAAVAVLKEKLFLVSSYYFSIFPSLPPPNSQQQFVINFECCNYFEIGNLDVVSEPLRILRVYFYNLPSKSLFIISDLPFFRARLELILIFLFISQDGFSLFKWIKKKPGKIFLSFVINNNSPSRYEEEIFEKVFIPTRNS